MHSQLISALPAEARDKRLALVSAVVSLVVFVALAPFATVPIGRVDAFIPTYQSALVVADLTTAALLFGHWSVSRARSLAILASAYLFTAVITVAHLLTFPGLFPPPGLLAAGAQSTAWLYMFWHAIFPLFVVAYAAMPRARLDTRGAFAAALAAIGLAVGLTALATSGEASLPAIMSGHGYTPAYSATVLLVWLATFAALIPLWIRRNKTKLDIWLMVVLCVWACDIGLSAVFNAGRFDLGFYAGRIYGLFAVGFLLCVLLFESVALPRRLGAALQARLDAQVAIESEARLRLAAAAAHFGTYDADLRTGTMYWSPEARSILDMATNQASTFADIVPPCVHPDDRSDVATAMRISFDPHGAGMFQHEYRIVHRDGSVHWVFQKGETRFDGDSDPRQPVRAIGVIADITQRKELEHELRRRVHELAEADRRKDDFIAMLGHELRNPLAPIRNAAQILRMVGSDEPAAAKAREMIDRQSAHMARLMDDLLDIARITHGRLEINKVPCNMTAIVRDAAEDYRASIEAVGLRLNVSLPAETIWVNGDPTRLNQIIGNVLHNALKFTERGGEISVRLQCIETGCEVRISDTGIGMDAQTLSRMFQSFNQSDRSLDRSRGGLGLGMALVKHLVELHGGRVAASSAGLNKGSEFVVEIPIERVPSPAKSDSSTVSSGASLRVLVIEDNVDAAESLCVLLRLKGHSAETAHTGAEGLAMARSLAPQIIFCDIGLPGMDGYAVARAIRSDPQLSRTYLIALTGYGQQEDQRRTREAGFDLHLLKPIDYAALEMALAVEVARGQADRASTRKKA